MAKNSHLTFDDRIEIETGLHDNVTFTGIGAAIGKDPTTVSKEVRNHVIFKKPGLFNPCAHRDKCPRVHDICSVCSDKRAKNCAKCKCECYKVCPDYVEAKCPRLQKAPYVCNGCKNRMGCKLERRLYDAKAAQQEYEALLSESRQGVSVSDEELKRLDDIISPLIKAGQSIHVICVNNADDIMLDERTIYNYVDAGCFSATNLDLPRKVRRRTRKRKKTVRVDKQCHTGRTYNDYLAFMKEYPDLPVVEADSVEGRKGGKVLLTLHFTNCNLMLAFIRDHNTARSVTEVFDRLFDTLGSELFQKLFPVILADRGSEFTDPSSIEVDKRTGELRTRVFYCDPNRSDQKGACEVNHELIRRVIPKGKSFDHLTQEDIDRMMSHINSYLRKMLNDRTPSEVFALLHGEDVLAKLNLKQIPANKVVVTPRILEN